MKSSVTLPQIKQKLIRNTLLSNKNTIDPYNIAKIKKDNIVKQFEDKIEAHKNQIEKNNEFINMLTQNFQAIKNQLGKEKKINEQMQLTNKKLKDQIQKSNKIIKSQKLKLQQSQSWLIEIQGYKQTIKNYQTKQKDLIAQSNQSQDKKFKKLQSDYFSNLKNIQKLNKEIETYKNIIKKTGQEQLKLKQNIFQLKKQLENLKNETLQLKHLIKEFEYETNKLKNEKQEIQQNLKIIKEDFKEKQLNLLNKLKKQKDQIQKDKKNLQDQLQKLRKELSDHMDLNRQTENLKQVKLIQIKRQSQEKLKKILDQYNKSRQRSSSQIITLKEEISKNKNQLSKLLQIKKLQPTLIKSEKSIESTIKCQCCKQILKQPVTIIPCGHCYCLDCKKGYQKQCMKCGPKIKIDTLYRNELLDDILKIFAIIQSVTKLLNNI